MTDIYNITLQADGSGEVVCKWQTNTVLQQRAYVFLIDCDNPDVKDVALIKARAADCLRSSVRSSVIKAPIVAFLTVDNKVECRFKGVTASHVKALVFAESKSKKGNAPIYQGENNQGTAPVYQGESDVINTKVIKYRTEKIADRGLTVGGLTLCWYQFIISGDREILDAKNFVYVINETKYRVSGISPGGKTHAFLAPACSAIKLIYKSGEYECIEEINR